MGLVLEIESFFLGAYNREWNVEHAMMENEWALSKRVIFLNTMNSPSERAAIRS